MTAPEVYDDHHRATLARAVYEAVHDGVESFEEQRIGADLAYLLAAILKDSQCGWPASEPILAVLATTFPDRGHPVWSHIEIEPEDDDADAGPA